MYQLFAFRFSYIWSKTNLQAIGNLLIRGNWSFFRELIHQVSLKEEERKQRSDWSCNKVLHSLPW